VTTTFAEDILIAAGDEPIIAIAVGPTRRWTWDDTETDHNLGNEPVSWVEAFPVLNYHFDAGYGGQDCHDIWAWTPTRVLFVHEYDGATGVVSAPRFPVPFEGATQS
jgi:hypothetical protein